MTTLTEKEVKCRKPHTCDWCGERCETGEQAMYRVYVWNGDFGASYQHLECFEAMEKSDNIYLQDGWFTGDVKRGEIVT